ncbi:hypothetical protein [Roseibium sp. Sym1]|nr:hypothetical protein [Roseibium sp. Sym1]
MVAILVGANGAQVSAQEFWQILVGADKFAEEQFSVIGATNI